MLTGLVAEATASTITLLDGKNERTRLARARIERVSPAPVSLMPENRRPTGDPCAPCSLVPAVVAVRLLAA